jgi:REP element-mobilizing transposase RayT
MARPLRISFQGAVYHLLSRGNERKELFRDDQDRSFFLRTLGETGKIYSVVIHAYVLMDNHLHLMAETPLANVSAFMKRLMVTYAGYFNGRYRRSGHLFQGRYGSVLVDKETYLRTLVHYIHLNPARIKSMLAKPLVDRERAAKDWRWSSLREYLQPRHRQEWMEYAWMLAPFGGDTPGGRKAFWEQTRGRLVDGDGWKDAVKGGSVLGSEAFIEKVRTILEGKSRREQPAARRLMRHQGPERVLAILERILGLNRERIIQERGAMRWLAMEALVRYGGMNNREVGLLMGLDYSTVSLGRKRLRRLLEKDASLSGMMEAVRREGEAPRALAGEEMGRGGGLKVNNKDLTP